MPLGSSKPYRQVLFANKKEDVVLRKRGPNPGRSETSACVVWHMAAQDPARSGKDRCPLGFRVSALQPYTNAP